jgi:ABC-type transport system substrate-binding protein
MAEKKLITSITPEQEAQIPVYLNKYIDAVVKGQYYKNFTYEGAKALVDWQYDFAGFAKPMTIVANNPMEAQMINAYLMENYPKEIDQYLEETDEAKKQKLYKKVLALIKKANLKIPSSFADNYLFTSDVYTNVLIGWWIPLTRARYLTSVALKESWGFCWHVGETPRLLASISSMLRLQMQSVT